MLRIIFGHLLGQGVVTFLNIVVGILFIRWLPIEEFAIYALAVIVQSVVAVFSDFGIANAVNTLTARLSKKKKSSVVVMQEAFRLRRRFIPFALFSAFVLGWFLLSSVNVVEIRLLFLIVFVIVLGLIQSQLTIGKALLNARSQSDLLFKVGLVEAFLRLALSFLCFLYTYVEVAILINLIALLVAYLTMQYLSSDFQKTAASSSLVKEELLKFTLPLIPSTIYSLAQSHIGIFILSMLGASQMIAETTALSRLSQIFSLFLVLGPFWLQPHFARINSKKIFIKDLVVGMGVLTIIFSFVISSTYIFPYVWLWFLGDGYKSNNAELPIAMISSVIYLANTFFYTITLSRNATNWQSWTVIIGLTTQIGFLFFYDVDTTIDALIINMLPAISSLVIQIIILSHLIFNKSYKWNAAVE